MKKVLAVVIAVAFVAGYSGIVFAACGSCGMGKAESKVNKGLKKAGKTVAGAGETTGKVAGGALKEGGVIVEGAGKTTGEIVEGAAKTATEVGKGAADSTGKIVEGAGVSSQEIVGDAVKNVEGKKE
ncbi:MAG TPA: hypothetical protein P5287_01720 [bacterium]|nr:hypothetical protein [bacterium]